MGGLSNESPWGGGGGGGGDDAVGSKQLFVYTDKQQVQDTCEELDVAMGATK